MTIITCVNLVNMSQIMGILCIECIGSRMLKKKIPSSLSLFLAGLFIHYFCKCNLVGITGETYITCVLFKFRFCFGMFCIVSDSFLRSRNSQDHEATAMMKAQFMALWDGLITDCNCTVIIMGATNRPHDLDKAILRRMPSTFHIGLPVSLHHFGLCYIVSWFVWFDL